MIPLAIAFGVGALVGAGTGFVAGDGIAGLGKVGTVVVLGGAVFVAGKALKVF